MLFSDQKGVLYDDDMFGYCDFSDFVCRQCKEHVASYQIVCDDWKIHYVVNGNEYQYCLKLTQENQGKYEKASEEKTFVVLSNDKELSYQAVWNSLISSQYKYNDEVFYWLGYDE